MLNLRSVRSLILVRGSIVGFLLLVILYYLLYIPLKISLPILLATVIFLFFLVRSNARSTRYVCRKCSTRFQVSPWIDFCSPHRPNLKLLRCPQCGLVDWHSTE